MLLNMNLRKCIFCSSEKIYNPHASFRMIQHKKPHIKTVKFEKNYLLEHMPWYLSDDSIIMNARHIIKKNPIKVLKKCKYQLSNFFSLQQRDILIIEFQH